MQIPDYKKLGELVPAASSSAKPVPPLAQIIVQRSRRLITFYRIVYGALATSFSVAFYPWLAVSYGWWGVLILIMYLLFSAYSRQVANVFEGAFWYEKGCWHLKVDGRVHRHLLAGEVVCWSHVIVLPLMNTLTAKKVTIVIAADSLSPSDNSRLRTWLRVCLKPKG